MHYKELPGNWYMNYNSDVSGERLLCVSEHPDHRGQCISVPFEVIKAIVDTEEKLRAYRRLDDAE